MSIEDDLISSVKSRMADDEEYRRELLDCRHIGETPELLIDGKILPLLQGVFLEQGTAVLWFEEAWVDSKFIQPAQLPPWRNLSHFLHQKSGLLKCADGVGQVHFITTVGHGTGSTVSRFGTRMGRVCEVQAVFYEYLEDAQLFEMLVAFKGATPL